MSATTHRQARMDAAAAEAHRPFRQADALDAYRAQWWREHRFGMTHCGKLPPMDGEQAEHARRDTFDHYYAPCGHADLAVSRQLRSDTFTAIDKANARHRAGKSPAAMMRAELAERDGDDCWLCGEPLGDDRTIEHRVPKSRGGTDDMANLVLAHRSCNRLLGNAPAHVKDAVRPHLNTLSPERRAELNAELK